MRYKQLFYFMILKDCIFYAYTEMKNKNDHTIRTVPKHNWCKFYTPYTYTRPATFLSWYRPHLCGHAKCFQRVSDITRGCMYFIVGIHFVPLEDKFLDNIKCDSALNAPSCPLNNGVSTVQKLVKLSNTSTMLFPPVEDFESLTTSFWW